MSYSRKNTYFAKINGNYINNISLFTKDRMRIRKTTAEKESILYFEDEILAIKELHPSIEIIKKHISYDKNLRYN